MPMSPARRAHLEGALRAGFADWLTPVPSAAGLRLAALLAPDAAVDPAAVGRRARAAGVAVEDLASYRAEDPPRRGLVLSYGAVTTDGIAEGMRRLASCFRSPEVPDGRA